MGREPGITVEEVGWADPDAVGLRRALYQELAADHPQERAKVEAAGGFEWLDERGGRAVVGTLLARQGGRPVGCVSVRALTATAEAGGTVDIGEVRRMYVVPGHRGGLVAGVLLAAAEDLARRRELPVLVLAAGDDPKGSAEHYEAAGFRRIPPYPPHGADAACYGKDVDLRRLA